MKKCKDFYSTCCLDCSVDFRLDTQKKSCCTCSKNAGCSWCAFSSGNTCKNKGKFKKGGEK